MSLKLRRRPWAVAFAKKRQVEFENRVYGGLELPICEVATTRLVAEPSLYLRIAPWFAVAFFGLVWYVRCLNDPKLEAFAASIWSIQ